MKTIACITVLVLVNIGCASQSTNKSRRAKVIYPYSEASIITKKALDSYKNQYVKGKLHKAFAQSARGDWAWEEDKTSPENAIISALARCQECNKDSEDMFPCVVINVDGKWVKK